MWLFLLKHCWLRTINRFCERRAGEVGTNWRNHSLDSGRWSRDSWQYAAEHLEVDLRCRVTVRHWCHFWRELARLCIEIMTRVQTFQSQIATCSLVFRSQLRSYGGPLFLVDPCHFCASRQEVLVAIESRLRAFLSAYLFYCIHTLTVPLPAF